MVPKIILIVCRVVAARRIELVMLSNQPRQTTADSVSLDSASVFGAALSLYETCMAQARVSSVNLSAAYHGGDQFMREVVRVAQKFETWATEHVDFAEFGEVWPYFLRDRFGPACVSLLSATNLGVFDDMTCLQIALHLALPLQMDRGLPIPLRAESFNPIPNAAFRVFCIQTVRDSIDGKSVGVFMLGDKPFDPDYGPIYFSLYGVREDGLLEHIASRSTYTETVELATSMIPGLLFAKTPRRR